MSGKRWIPLLVVTALMLGLVPGAAAQEAASFGGVVFEDLNQNLQMDAGEPGIAGVAVSNGKEVVQTDADGRYTLPRYDEMIVFVSKPAAYATPLNEYNLPQFYYIHRPNGSPAEVAEYEGIAPTGDLPTSVDFPLFAAEASDTFKALVLGDTQVTDHTEIGYLRDGIVAELIGTDAQFLIAEGDNVNDVLSLYDRYFGVMSEIGIPMYFVIGNHDMNYDSPNDQYSLETFSRYAGPPYYSFDYGKVHFVVLDSVTWDGSAYHGELGATQLEWLANDLAFVPMENLVVLNMHIPFVSWQDRTGVQHMIMERAEVYAMLEGRNVLALGGHTHTLERFVPGDEAEGWGQAVTFPQTIVGAACGSWWSGPTASLTSGPAAGPVDEFGVPYSYQRDAAPKGYLIFNFDGNTYRETYKVAGRPADFQMNVTFMNRRAGGDAAFSDLPPSVFTAPELAGTTVIANVFSGSSASTVEMSVDGGAPVAMVKNHNVADPMGRKMTAGLDDWLIPTTSTHIWVAPLPTDLESGAHTLTVRTTDLYGQVHEGVKVFEVWDTGR